MIHYINIHTHKPIATPNNLEVINIVFGQEFTPDNSSIYSLGVHPWYLNNKINFDKFMRLSKHLSIVAIGECGLDYQKENLHKFSKTLQKEIFLKQIKIAEELQKPIIIHCVKCFDELIKLKKRCITTIPWIIHGFSKNKQVAQQLIDQGFYLSFGSLIFTSSKNQEALKIIPLEKLFLETDEQIKYNIFDIYLQATKIRDTFLDSLQKQIQENYERVFN